MNELFPLSSTAEVLRQVFLAQDALRFWDSKLSPHEIDLARTASAASSRWFSLVTADNPPLEPVFARLRPHLILAAVNDFTTSAIHPPIAPDDQRYEPDPGPPLGYPRHSHPYRLLGKDPPRNDSEQDSSVTKILQATTGLLASSQDDTFPDPDPLTDVFPDALLRKPPPPKPCAPSTPVVAPSSTSSPASPVPFLSLLGTDSVIARNTVSMHNLRFLRHRAQAVLAPHKDRLAPNSPASLPTPQPRLEMAQSNQKLQPQVESGADITKPDTNTLDTSDQDLTVISNIPRPNPAALLDAPPVSKIRATTALVLAHTGFTHASSIALDVLSDAATQFIERLGQSLASCRMASDDVRPARRDHHGIPVRSTDQFVEEMRRISTAGFRGGFPELQVHARGDMMRRDQALREAERRIREQLHMSRQVSPVSSSKGGPGLALQTKQDSSGAQNAEDREKSDSRQDDQSTQFGLNSEQKGEDIASTTSGVNVQLDTDAFALGYLSRKVHLDILNGVRVPRRLAYGGRTTLSTRKSPLGAEDNYQKAKRKRCDSKNTPEQSVRVKLEAKAVETGNE